MSVLTILHISLEFWGAFLCMFALVGIIAGTSRFKADRKTKIGMQICCLVLMISDMCYMALNGNPNSMAHYYITRVSKYMVFFSNYTYLGFSVVFLWQSLAEIGENVPKRVYAVISISIACIMLVTISQFNGMIYYFDDNNMYHRNTFYPIIQIAVIVAIVITFTILMQYRKRLDNFMFCALLSYFILPTIATVLVILKTGLSLQNFAVVISTQIMFAVDFVDVSHRLDKSQAAYVKAKYASQHDSMTSVYNKTAGMSLIREYMNNMDKDDAASLCFIDIDDFKTINDTLGHVVGDYWIKQIAALLVKTCRSGDIVCRFGGDEFLVLLKGTVDTEALKSKIFQFDQHLKLKSIERGHDVHCSIGVCQLIGGRHSLNRAIELADEALYEVKRSGKNSCVIYQLDSDNVKNPDKQQINLKESFNMQDRVYHKFMNLFVTVAYVNLENGTYNIIKEDKELKKYMPADSNYISRIPVFVKKYVVNEYKNDVAQFVSYSRMRNQVKEVDTMAFDNINGNKCLLHTVADKDNNSCVIIVQEIKF